MNLTFLLRKNNVSYNLLIANLFGVISAIFIQFILECRYSDVKLVDDKYFLLSRQQIYQNTGLDDEKINQVENHLVQWNILDVKPVKNNSDKFYYYLNEELLLKTLNAESKDDVLNLVTKKGEAKPLIISPREKPVSKRQQTILNLKKSVYEKDVMVRESIYNWIDGVYSNPKGFLSAYSIKENLKTLDNKCSGNNKLKISILNIAAKNGWRDLNWAIENYEKNNSSSQLYNDFTKEQLSENINKIVNGGGQEF